MLLQIKFTASGSSSAVGDFAPGDIARVSAALARHLVEDARVATYSKPVQPAQAAPIAPAPAQAAPRTRRGKKA